ncbi:hypothetical protein SODALDRAFT_122593 [Sodiomyces alkalinus F11]|uniref:Uncharacterized protein n=1 Tax=Sodiomyces alkalinus (strain CBS 110278 / VKM F-3762 / F11) TaxID=1314773 RepID=A0A3N2Q4H7_SODAK|nr:hypothetical protein SODALDRAFT_122593 [Sodiomyces alkalinus F11]ROT41558.1 hypothetical protein SODALDRAFT_122593 [Sodiomyces alkalinus F11]
MLGPGETCEASDVHRSWRAGDLGCLIFRWAQDDDVLQCREIRSQDVSIPFRYYEAVSSGMGAANPSLVSVIVWKPDIKCSSTLYTLFCVLSSLSSDPERQKPLNRKVQFRSTPATPTVIDIGEVVRTLSRPGDGHRKVPLFVGPLVVSPAENPSNPFPCFGILSRNEEHAWHRVRISNFFSFVSSFL